MKITTLTLEDPALRDSGSRIRDHHLVSALGSIGTTESFFFGDRTMSPPGANVVPRAGRLGSLVKSVLRNKLALAVELDWSRHGKKLTQAVADCDLVYVSMLYSMAHICDLKSQGVPVAPTVWDTQNFDPEVWAQRAADSVGPRRWVNQRQQRVSEREVHRALRDATLVIACTDRDAEMVSASTDRDVPIAVVPNGFDPELWTFQAERALTQTVVSFGSLAQAATREGLELLLRTVWPEVRERVPEAELLIAGRDPDQRFAKTYDQLPNVTVISNPRNVGEVVASAAVVCLPQRRGTGSKLKAIEALTLGVPVVAFPQAVVGLPETLTAEFDIVASPQEMASRLATALSQPSASSRTELLAPFTWTEIGRSLEAALRRVGLVRGSCR